MNSSEHPDWPARPHLTGRFELYLAIMLTVFLITFLVGGFLLAASIERVIIASEYAEPGTVVAEGILYLGATGIGTDLLGEMVNATWFSIWITGISTLTAMAVSWPISISIRSKISAISFSGRMLLRVLCGIGPFPLFALIIVSGVYYPNTLFPLFCLLVIFATPFFVQHFSQPLHSFDPASSLLSKLLALWFRRWSTLSMLVFLLGFFFWLRGGGGNTLSDQMRDNATLIMFDVYTPLYPVVVASIIALTLRLWAAILEDRVKHRLDPFADSWMFLPTILENELDEARVRKEYEGLY